MLPIDNNQSAAVTINRMAWNIHDNTNFTDSTYQPISDKLMKLKQQ